MSRITSFGVLLLIAVSSGTAAAPKHQGSMSATVNGASWESVVISAAAIQGGVLRVAGQDHMEAPFVAVGIAVPPKVGTYTVSAATGASVAGSLVEADSGRTFRQWNADWKAGSGTVTLTTITATRAAGSFSFTLVHVVTASTGTKVIANGKFDITF
jgi:hypothetical protein